MSRGIHLAIALVAVVSPNSAGARDCHITCCDCRVIRSVCPREAHSETFTYRGYPPLRNASPQDPSGRIVLDGAGGE